LRAGALQERALSGALDEGDRRVDQRSAQNEGLSWAHPSGGNRGAGQLISPKPAAQKARPTEQIGQVVFDAECLAVLQEKSLRR